MDMSTWVLSRVIPDESERFQALCRALADADAARRRFAFAELADFLRPLPPGAFRVATSHAPRAQLDPVALNYLAGAIELAAERRDQTPPAWTRDVPIPETPVFGSSLNSLRLYLLTRGPVALRRRNIFVDASVDERV